MKRKLAVILATIVATTALVTGTATQANAADSRISGRAGLHYCIENTAACTYHLMFAAGSAHMVCWRDGRSATGAYTSNRWFYVTQGSKKGWAHSSWVTNQVRTPNCSTRRDVSKASWAAARIGETKASPTVARWLGWQADPRWSGGCAGFGAASLRFGFGAEPRFKGNAYAKFLSYRNVGKANGWVADPPIGSSVFWSAGPYGHEAVYLGGGVVATTWGNVGNTYANTRKTIAGVGLGTPVGYVSPNNY